MYECSKCKNNFVVEYDREQHNQIPKPYCCQVDEEPDPQITKKCDSTKFKEIPTKAGELPGSCKDYQEIKIQEHLNKLSVGTIPRSITVILENDLADVCKAGVIFLNTRSFKIIIG